LVIVYSVEAVGWLIAGLLAVILLRLGTGLLNRLEQLASTLAECPLLFHEATPHADDFIWIVLLLVVLVRTVSFLVRVPLVLALASGNFIQDPFVDCVIVGIELVYEMLHCLILLFLGKLKVILVEVVGLKVLHQLSLVGPQEHGCQQLKMPTCLDEVEDVDLPLKSTERLLMQGLLLGSPLVALSLLEAATEPHCPLGCEELKVREETADTVQHSCLDLLLVL
jgi:hypothetical protein